jgi:hypothetical protein
MPTVSSTVSSVLPGPDSLPRLRRSSWAGSPTSTDGMLSTRSGLRRESPGPCGCPASTFPSPTSQPLCRPPVEPKDGPWTSRLSTPRSPTSETLQRSRGNWTKDVTWKESSWRAPSGTWKATTLDAQDPKELVVEMPLIQIIPIEANKLKLKGTIKTPVYVTQAR